MNSMKNQYQPLIFVVDDTELNLKVVKGILKEKDYRIMLIQDSTMVFDMVKEMKPDLILLDIMMPELDGYDVCKKLKEDLDVKEIPVIFLTAKTDTNSIISGFQIGGVDYITKPFRREELLARVQNQLDLYMAKNELKESNLTRDKLFSIISHDLRGPISSIMGILKNMVNQKESMSSELMDEMILELSKSVENTYMLLENLLAWAKSQSNSIKLDPLVYELKPVFKECVDILEDLWKKKSIEISINMEDNLTALFDLNTLNTVIRNLLSNAIKFTPQNGKISISGNSDEEYIKIEITDSGVGIKPNALNAIFQIEKNKSTKGTNGEQGSGLGLVLCKEFIDKNKGKIWVESEPGKGTKFTFTLKKS
jgi:two-component system, sensor histidine kinase and response regulator